MAFLQTHMVHIQALITIISYFSFTFQSPELQGDQPALPLPNLVKTPFTCPDKRHNLSTASALVYRSPDKGIL